jgi:hypothetical protein
MSTHTLHGNPAIKLERVSVKIKTHVGAYFIFWNGIHVWVPKSLSKLEYNVDSVDMIVTEWFYNKHIKGEIDKAQEEDM